MRLIHARASLGVKAPNGFGKASGARSGCSGVAFWRFRRIRLWTLGVCNSAGRGNGKGASFGLAKDRVPHIPLKIRYQKKSRRSTPNRRLNQGQKKNGATALGPTFSPSSSRRPPLSRWLLGKSPWGGTGGVSGNTPREETEGQPNLGEVIVEKARS